MTANPTPQAKPEFRLFQPLEGELTTKRIWLWWEKRRLLYNVLVIVMGILSLVIFVAARMLSGLIPADSTTDDLIPSLGFLFVIYVGPIAWNVCYSLGPLAEIWSYKTDPKYDSNLGPRLLRIGMIISAFVAFSPAFASLMQGGAYFLSHHR